MSAELVIAPEAEHDIADAYAWYEAQRLGLGEEFLNCVEACLEAICRSPAMNAIIHEDHRRGLVRRFPYAVFYDHRDGKVTVYGIFHTSREPSKWRRRLS